MTNQNIKIGYVEKYSFISICITNRPPGHNIDTKVTMLADPSIFKKLHFSCFLAKNVTFVSIYCRVGRNECKRYLAMHMQGI